MREKDPLLYEKYGLNPYVKYIYTKTDSDPGVGVYSVDCKNGILNLLVLAAYPNYNVQCKEALLNELKKIARVHNCERIVVRGVSGVNNRGFYQSYTAKRLVRYWRGSKSI